MEYKYSLSAHQVARALLALRFGWKWGSIIVVFLLLELYLTAATLTKQFNPINMPTEALWGLFAPMFLFLVVLGAVIFYGSGLMLFYNNRVLFTGAKLQIDATGDLHFEAGHIQLNLSRADRLDIKSNQKHYLVSLRPAFTIIIPREGLPVLFESALSSLPARARP